MTAPHAPLPPHTIRAYDIRGLAPEEIDAEAAAHVGRGFASWLRRHGGETVAIGHDARPTSSELYGAAIDGLTSAGVVVTALGLCPTPVVGWAVDQLSLGGGMIVTASHNPPTFNGFKLLGPHAVPLRSDDIATVARGGTGSRVTARVTRGERRHIDITPDYLEMLSSRFASAAGLRVAVDPGNGVVSLTGPAAVAATGARTHALHHTVLFESGRLADPQEPSTMIDLARTVTTLRLDLGIAWDADGDRIGVVDHRGYRYEADWLVALLARPLLERRPGAPILLDAKASRSAIEDVAAHGGEPASRQPATPAFVAGCASRASPSAARRAATSCSAPITSEPSTTPGSTTASTPRARC